MSWALLDGIIGRVLIFKVHAERRLETCVLTNQIEIDTLEMKLSMKEREDDVEGGSTLAPRPAQG